MPEDIIVVGAGGFGREALDVIEAINVASSAQVWNVVGVADDEPASSHASRIEARGVRLLGGLDAVREHGDTCRYVIGIGDPAVRARIAATIDSWGLQPATLVHPAATLGTLTELAPGTIVCGGAQLSTNLRCGAHVHINPGAIIGHDSVLEDFVSINPGAIISGEVLLRREAMIGASATVLQGLEVGEGAVVGAAACVTRNVEAGAIARGIPARW